MNEKGKKFTQHTRADLHAMAIVSALHGQSCSVLFVLEMTDRGSTSVLPPFQASDSHFFGEVGQLLRPSPLRADLCPSAKPICRQFSWLTYGMG